MVCFGLHSGCATGVDGRGNTAGRAVLMADASAAWPGDVKITLRQRDGYLLLPAAVNGEPAGWLMLDTGANQIVLDEGLANRMNLRVAGTAKSTGVAGQADVRIREVDRVTIGPGRVAHDATDAGIVDIELGDRSVLSLSMLKLSDRLGGGGVNGLVGFPALAEVPFTIDVTGSIGGKDTGGTLTLHNPKSFAPPKGAVSVPLRIYRRLPVVEAIVGGPGAGSSQATDRNRGERVWLILDWGSDHGVSLPGALMQRRPDLASIDVAGTSRVQGVGGTALTQETWVRSITLFGQTLEHEPVTIENLPPQFNQAPLPVGRLGHELMRKYRMTFDLARQQLYIIPAGR